MCDQGHLVRIRKRGKQAIREMVSAGDLEGVVRHARETGAKRTFRHLLTVVHAREDVVRRRAIVACGRVAGVLAEEDLEAVREMVRRLLWWMNDESGALLRVAPEVIAEILLNVDALVDEYARLLPRFTHEEPFERGASRAVARLAEVRPDALAGFAESLRPGLDSEDAQIRALTERALRALGAYPFQ